MSDSKRAKRDGRGRFLPGTAPGPGNPNARRVHALKRAIYRAATPEAIADIFSTLLHLGSKGDVAAARLVLEYAIGKPRTDPGDPVSLNLPQIVDARSVVEAAGVLVSSLADGAIATEEAGRIGSLLEVARKVIETSELEARLNELEARLKEVTDAAA